MTTQDTTLAWKPTPERPYRTDAEHQAINKTLDDLGGYDVVFDALSVSVTRHPPEGLGLSPMTFAAVINQRRALNAQSPAPEGEADSGKSPPHWSPALNREGRDG